MTDKPRSLNEDLGWLHQPRVPDSLPTFTARREEITYESQPLERPRASLRQRLRYLITGRQ